MLQRQIVFCNVIGYRQITPGKAINLMKPEELAEVHQTLLSSWEGGVWARDYARTAHETANWVEVMWYNFSSNVK